MEKEVRVLYARLAREIGDLAALQIPVNLLYDRFDTPLTTAPPDTRTSDEKETSSIFSFLDPRLQHLKPNFTRESL